MSRPGQVSSLSLVLFVAACSPAQPAPVVAKPVPAPSTSVTPPAVASHARWLSRNALEGVTNAQLDLGPQGVLQVGTAGRRWLVARDGTVSASPYLLPSALVDVRAEGKRFLLLGHDGTTYLADEPLGPAVIVRGGPELVATPDSPPTFSAGKTALFGLASDGTLFRSTDAGASWKGTKLPVHEGDEAVGIASNRTGEVLVLLYPQRVLYSSDDGATFIPLATPGIGAERIEADPAGDLWLSGAIVEKRAKLVGTPRRLEVTVASPASFVARKAEPTKTEAKAPRRHVVGDRIVNERDSVDPVTKRRRIVLSVETFGGEPSAPFELAASASPFARVRLAGHDKELVAVVHEPEADPPSSKLFRSTDDGKSWQSFDTLEGREATGFRVLVAPNWVAVGELCDHDGQCRPARARTADKKDWQPLGLPPRLRLSSVEYDAARDRLLVVADDGKSTQIWAGKRTGKLLRVEAHELEARPVATTMTSTGALLFAYGAPWRVRELAVDGKVSAPSYLPFEVQSLDFAGDRGFAHGSGKAWETADAGRHWTKVANGSSGALSCSPSGCLQGEGERAGWDLPDPVKPLVAATDKPLAQESAASAPPAAPGPPIKIACKPTGKPQKMDGTLWGESRAALDGDVRFVSLLGGEDSTTAIGVVKGNAGPTKVKMLAPPPKSTTKAVREWIDTKAEGVVIARYSYDPNAKYLEDGTKEYNPVDVELAWYSAATGQAHKASLPKLKPFRVGRVAASALHVIADGGLLFMPTTGEAPLFFLRDDGKTLTIPRPVGADPWGFSEAAKVGDRIILAQERGDAVALISTDDLGKTWSTTVWSLGQPVSLFSSAGQMTLALGFNPAFAPANPTGLLPLGKLSADPPQAKLIAPNALGIGKQGIVACNPKTRAGMRVYTWTGAEAERDVAFDFPSGLEVPESLPMTGRFSRLALDGSACIDLIFASTQTDKGTVQLFEPTEDPGHSWLALVSDDGKVRVQQVACTP